MGWLCEAPEAAAQGQHARWIQHPSTGLVIETGPLMTFLGSLGDSGHVFIGELGLFVATKATLKLGGSKQQQ